MISFVRDDPAAFDLQVVSIDTPVGKLHLFLTEKGVGKSQWQGIAPTHTSSLSSRQSAWISQILDYFSGRLRFFRLPLVYHPGRLSPFSLHLYQTLLEHVTYARTTTYGQLAAMAGNPHAARAVGGCLSRNPWPIIIPCHRVISGDGGLGGYQNGAKAKRYLIDLERKHAP